MNVIFIDAAFLGVAATAGFLSGCCFRLWNRNNVQITFPTVTREQNEKDKAQTKELMVQLQSLAANVAAQVGEHNNRVQEINSELTSPEGVSGDAVFAAITKLVEANNRMHEQLQVAEQRLEEKSREIESRVSEARTDALTQINNRRAFDEEMKRCLEDYQQQGRPSCVMMLDVDFFKKFNDTHGHKAGDEVLKHVASTLKETVAHTEVVCRYGGEEFAVIFPGSTLTTAKAAAERARAAIGNSKIEFEGKSLRVTASAGLAEFQRDEDIEAVMKRADDALYLSKKSGRNCGHYNDGSDYVPFVPRTKIDEPAPGPPVQIENIRAVPVAATPPAVVEEKPVLRDEFSGRDPLTGMSNSIAFYDDVSRRIAEWKRGGTPLSIIFMQIDGLPKIVDEHGTSAESLIVKAGAQFLKATCRDMDHISRYDDDMFSMLLPTARLQNAATIAERLRKAVSKCKLPFNGASLSFTVSFGVAEAVQGDSTSRLVQRGCAAVNTASNSGGNRTYIHNGERAFPVAPVAAVLEV